MNIVIAYLKAFRYQNLLIIAFTMYLMRWFIMEPFVELHQLQLQMSEFHFGLLVISTVFIAAGGYLINDYFDLKIDKINKPEKIIIGRFVCSCLLQTTGVLVCGQSMVILFFVKEEYYV